MPKLGTFNFWIEWLDELMQLRSRRHLVDLCEEAVTPRQLFLGGVFEVGKTLLHGRLVTGERALLSQVWRAVETGSGE
jgi:hypothetical protein